MSTQGSVAGVVIGLLLAAGVGWLYSQDIIFTFAVMPIGIVIGAVIGDKLT